MVGRDGLCVTVAGRWHEPRPANQKYETTTKLKKADETSTTPETKPKMADEKITKKYSKSQ